MSREFDTGSLKPLEQPETVDALRLMVRTWIKKRPEEIAQRIAGKVTDKVDLSNSDGTLNPYMTMPKDELLAIAKKILENNG